MRAITRKELIAKLECFALIAPTPERRELWSRLALAFKQGENCEPSGDDATADVRQSKQTGESFAFLFPARIYRADGESVQITHLYHVYVTEDGRAFLMTPTVAEAILEPNPERE